MTYVYYKVLDKDNNIAFQCVSNNIWNEFIYNKKNWYLKDLMSYFVDEEYTIDEVEFTTEELNEWLLQRGILRKVMAKISR